MKKLAILIILSVCTTILSNAQTQNYADSLRRLMTFQKVEAAKMQIKIQLGDYFEKTNADSALYWYKQAIPANLDDSTSVFSWAVNATDAERYLFSLALAKHSVLSLKTTSSVIALKNIEIACNLADQINQPPISVYCTDNLALYYANNKEIDKAIRYFEKSLESYKKIGNAGGVSYCLSNLGALNAQTGNFSKAAEYFSEQLNFNKQNQQPSELLQAYINIASLYQRSEDFENAKKHWAEALILSEQLNKNNYSIVISGLGNSSFKSGDLNKATEAYSKLLEHSTQTADEKNKLTALNNLAMLNTEQGNYTTALEYWQNALAIAEANSLTPVMLDALLNLSNINLSLGNFNESASQFDKYISIVKQQSNPQELAEAYIKSGKLNDRSLQFEKSRGNYLDALKIYENISDTIGIATTNIAIAKSFTQQGHYNRAIEFVNAVLIQENKFPQPIIATAYQVFAEIFRLQHHFANAIENYQKSLSIWQLQSNDAKVIECLNTMGSIYETTGNLPQSIKFYQQALSISNKQSKSEASAAILNNIGVVYRLLGDNAKAKESYQNALDINLKNGNSERVAYGYNNLGIILEQEGKFDEAIQNYEKSIAIKAQSNDQKGLAASLVNLGNVYKRLNRNAEAEEKFLNSLAISQTINDKQSEAFAYGNLAALKLEQNEFNTSIEYSKKNLEIAKTIDLKQPLKEAYRQLAWAYELTAQLDSAEANYKRIIEINQQEINANFSVLSENEKELFFKTVADDYDRFYAFAYRRQMSNPKINIELYNSVLRNKGLLLKSSTAMRNVILASNNPEIIGKYDQWTSLKQTIAQQYALPANKRSSQLQAMETNANNLERDLVMTSSEFSAFQNASAIDWTEIRNKLAEKEAAIEFVHFKRTKDSTYYAALIIDKNSEYPVFQGLFEEKKLEKLMGTLGGNNLRFVQNIYGTLAESNTELFKLIWKSLEPFIKGYKTIYYSPAGLLHKVSFSAISKSKDRFLIDDYNLQLVSTTANAGVTNQTQPISFSQVTLFGGIKYSINQTDSPTWKYLQGTLSETEMISNLFQEKNINVTRLTDTLAREEDFKTLAPKSSILHIATHGFFYPDPDKLREIMDAEKEVGKIQFRGGDDTRGNNVFIQSSNPLMRSGLVFARANDFWGTNQESTGDDGVLTALEVLNVDLRNNQLVVMSACETGLGDIAGSEGVYGLQRAFRMAGSSKLIMSLWQVPDAETAEFMKLLYTNLLNTSNLRESFNTAQKQMREKYDPYFWAAFVLLE